MVDRESDLASRVESLELTPRPTAWPSHFPPPNTIVQAAACTSSSGGTAHHEPSASATSTAAAAATGTTADIVAASSTCTTIITSVVRGSHKLIQKEVELLCEEANDLVSGWVSGESINE